MYSVSDFISLVAPFFLNVSNKVTERCHFAFLFRCKHKVGVKRAQGPCVVSSYHGFASSRRLQTLICFHCLRI